MVIIYMIQIGNLGIVSSWAVGSKFLEAAISSIITYEVKEGKK